MFTWTACPRYATLLCYQIFHELCCVLLFLAFERAKVESPWKLECSRKCFKCNWKADPNKENMENTFGFQFFLVLENIEDTVNTKFKEQ